MKNGRAMNDSNIINKGSLPGLKEKRYLQKKAIIGFLYKMGELSKPEICRLTNVTTPTVTRMIEELMDEGWVIDRGAGILSGASVLMYFH